MNSKIIHYTATDIARYHNGQLTAAQMYAMELQALEDPLLADAIDGYAALTQAETNEITIWLQQNLPNAISKAKVIPIKQPFFKLHWKKIAVAASIAGIAFTLATKLRNTNKQQEVAQNKTVQSTATDTTTVSATTIDTSFTTINQNGQSQPINSIVKANKNTVFIKPDALEQYYKTGTVQPVIVEKALITEDVKEYANKALDTAIKYAENDVVINKEKATVETDNFNKALSPNNSSNEEKRQLEVRAAPTTVFNQQHQ